MQTRTWKNTTLGISLTITYFGNAKSTDAAGVNCYHLRKQEIVSSGLFGTHFVDDFGNDLFLMRANRMLTEVYNLYETPAGITIEDPWK